MGSQSKYSKTRLVGKRWLSVIIVALIVILIVSISYIVYVNTTNIIVYENINYDSSTVDDNIASKSTPIIVNNIVLGGVYENKWVSMDRYYFKSINKESFDIDIFTSKGKTGTFKLKSVDKNDESLTAYAITTRTNYADEYFAVKSGSTTTSKMDKITLDDDSIEVYKDYVSKALGLYKALNSTVKIREVYEVALVPGKISYIITATNEGNTSNGVYSTVVYVSDIKDVQLIKYNYVKNVNNSSEFAIYTTKFIADLNGNKESEIILQETKEFKTKYSILELNNGKFYEVLSTTINN